MENHFAKSPTIESVVKEPIDAWEEQRRKPWHVYVDAKIGFRDHWYPAFFSAELPEGDVSNQQGDEVSNFKSLTMLGERILFRRVEGQVYAVQDWCLHRGVAFSRRPECYTQDSITCWYHGFTYKLRDGELSAIITDPDSPLIGKLRLRTYPVQEHKGLVFVFIGDGDPSPIEHDLQPGFLDEKMAIHPDGWWREVKCNWRPAAENGFDPAHAYIHRNSKLVQDYKLPTLLGDTDITRAHGMDIVEPAQGESGPCGVKLLRTGGRAVWEADVHGVKVEARYRPEDEGVAQGVVPKEVSMWLPCGLKVDPFPTANMCHFEWYVPIDENTHRYIMTWGSYVANSEERSKFHHEVSTVWRERVPHEFNVDDIFAREAMAEFYSRDEGWYRERLFGPDIVITTWRKLASKYGHRVQGRGLQ